MNEFIDIHTHLAWDIDDGFSDSESVNNALKSIKEDGITTIVATPHVVPGQTDQKLLETIKIRIKELKELASRFDISVYEGCEVFLNNSYLDLFEQKLYFPLANSDYVLVEFDVRKNIVDNNDVEDMLYEIKIRNKIPVIAHAERYFHDGINIDRIQEWIDIGCYIQINRTSLLGMHGNMAKKNAKKLLCYGLAHIISSDAHHDKGNRICKFSDIYALLEKDFGKETADILCKRNPKHIICNESLESIKIKKAFALKWLWRK